VVLSGDSGSRVQEIPLQYAAWCHTHAHADSRSTDNSDLRTNRSGALSCNANACSSKTKCHTGSVLGSSESCAGSKSCGQAQARLWLWLCDHNSRLRLDVGWLLVDCSRSNRLSIGINVTRLSHTHRLWLSVAHWLRLSVAHWLRLSVAHRLRLSVSRLHYNLGSWLRVAHRLRLRNHRSSWLSVAHAHRRLSHSHAHWLSNAHTHSLSNAHTTFTEVMEDDFTKLEAFLAVAIVEVELDSLRVAMDFRESETVPELHSKVELPVSNLVPSSSEHVPGEDADFGGRHSWVIASALEANASKNKFMRELNFDPRSVMMSSLPLVPDFLAWTQQILRLAGRGTWSDNVMFRSNYCCSVQVIPLHLSNNVALHYSI